jgi:DNA-binding transcriptional regulator GbsR (MarR family)
MNQREENFVEAMGLHFEAEGVPRIGGRIYAFLLLQDEPCSLDDLAEHLAVSKTSVSTNARLLEQRGLLQRTTRPGDRRDYYTSSGDLTRTLEVALQMVRRRGDLYREGAAAASSKAAVRRLTAMARFNDDALRLLEKLLGDWKNR